TGRTERVNGGLSSRGTGLLACADFEQARTPVPRENRHPVTQAESTGANDTISSSLNHRAISLAAFSVESLPWIRLFWMLMPKSPRIVPGADLAPSVAPIRLRATATASRPSSTSATVGPEVRKEISEP